MLIVLVVLVAACACARVPPPSMLTVCGTVLHTGRESIGLTPLEAPSPGAFPSAPESSTLPTIQADPQAAAEFVRVSPGCAHGAVVTITPAGAVTIDGAALGDDGKPVALALTAQQPAVIQAWVGGTYQGQLALP